MNPALSCKTNKLTKWASHPKFNCATSSTQPENVTLFTIFNKNE